MIKTPRINVKEGREDWVKRPTDPRGGSVKVQFKVPWILGNWGHNVGDIVDVPIALANQLIRNGKATRYNPPAEPPPAPAPTPPPAVVPDSPKRGRPKGSKNRPRFGR